MSASQEGVLALLYAAGGRPSLEDVRRAGEATGEFAVTFAPGEDPGWAEVLITGLTFEVSGLAPGPSEPVPPVAHRFGLKDNQPGAAIEAVIVRPGPHLAGAAAMLPVVRGCSALAAALAGHTRATAVVWIPARSVMSVDYFASMIADWLGGGAFPALGLTALVAGLSGIESEGLGFFTGQELEVLADSTGAPGRTARTAIRMIDLLVNHGRLAGPMGLTGPEGEPLWAEPVDGGHKVCVRPQE